MKPSNVIRQDIEICEAQIADLEAKLRECEREWGWDVRSAYLLQETIAAKYVWLDRLQGWLLQAVHAEAQSVVTCQHATQR